MSDTDPRFAARPERAEATRQREERHAKAQVILTHHPASADDLVALGCFNSRSAAGRTLTRWCDDGLLKFYGRFRMKGTKPEYLYVARSLKISQEHLFHEALLRKLVFKYYNRATSVLCGGDVDQRLEPDATIRFGDIVYHLELDRGEMSLGRMRERFACYAGCEDVVLVATTGHAQRIANLRGVCGEATEQVFIANLSTVLANPFGPVWEDADGDHLPIELE